MKAFVSQLVVGVRSARADTPICVCGSPNVTRKTIELTLAPAFRHPTHDHQDDDELSPFPENLYPEEAIILVETFEATKQKHQFAPIFPLRKSSSTTDALALMSIGGHHFALARMFS